MNLRVSFSLNLLKFDVIACLRKFGARFPCLDHGAHFHLKTFSKENLYHRNRHFAFQNVYLNCLNAFGALRFNYFTLYFQCLFSDRLKFACSFQEFQRQD